jgi:hypothetical protein
MEDINIPELVNGYRDRIRRLILIDPLLELERKREIDEQEKEIDMLGLGVLTLLFFFERRLSREYKTGIYELMQFLERITREVYIIGEDQLEKIARSIIQTFRPSSGVKRNFPFYNWETHKEDRIEYSILKNNDFDLKTNTQYYTLDEDGLELIFSTKEFYSEYQISINQLLLRQQIMKGEFHGALRQIREMEIDVDTLKERMEKVKLEILRSIVSEETFERYKKLLDDTYIRLEREDEEFKALKTFITETTDALYTGDIRQKEQQSYSLLLKITKELEAVHYEHGRLLTLTSDLKTTALTTAQESLYYTGIQSFNFDKDIVTEIISKPLPPEAMKGVLVPFLKVEENPLWSPMTVFAAQSITEEQEDSQDTHFIEAESDEAEDQYRIWLAEKYRELMSDFLEHAEKENVATLRDWMEYLQKTNEKILGKRYFYSFWMLLHQRSPVTYDLTENDEEQSILGEALAFLSNRKLVIQELPEIIRLHTRYSIQNMKIKVEVREE